MQVPAARSPTFSDDLDHAADSPSRSHRFVTGRSGVAGGIGDVCRLRRCWTNGAAGPAVQPLVIYCAASNQSVLEAIRADYERDYKTPLQIQYGPSQTLLAALTVTGDRRPVSAGRRQLSGPGPRQGTAGRRVSAGRDAGRRRRAQGESEKDRRAGRSAAGRCSPGPGQSGSDGHRQAHPPGPRQNPAVGCPTCPHDRL